MKQKTTLTFPDLFQLWSFAQYIQVSNMEISTTNKSLTCECKGADIELAQEKYGASVIGQEQFT